MLSISIRNELQQTDHEHESGALMIGRSPGDDIDSLTVSDRFVSRRHLLVEQVNEDEMRIEVIGSSPVTLADGTVVELGEQRTIRLPVQMVVGYTQIRFSVPGQSPIFQEARAGLATIYRPVRSTDAESIAKEIGGIPSAKKIAQWFEALLMVQKSAAGSSAFYEETARAVVDLIGLDRGLVLLREDGDWRTVASHSVRRDDETSYSQTVLDELLSQHRTFFESAVDHPAAESLARIDAYVASPIFGRDDTIVGAVFGSRDLRSANNKGIDPLEAQFVQLLAGAVSAGLARLDQEAESARLQVQLERFASAKVVRELKLRPTLLDPQSREISVLFADIRRFSSISEAIGPELTYELIRDVMNQMTECVMESDGLIIDYAGDGLAAMWNAPTDQISHASLACECAYRMQATMIDLRSVWRSRINDDVSIGIGIHTGIAQVGNSGSTMRMKYSPIGHTVNLASRIEGATKQVGVATLVTAATKDQLSEEIVTRRLGRIHVIGVREPIDIHQLVDPETKWLDAFSAYEQALDQFESHHQSAALELISAVLSAIPNDRPSQLLKQRIIDADSDATPRMIIDLDRK